VAQTRPDPSLPSDALIDAGLACRQHHHHHDQRVHAQDDGDDDGGGRDAATTTVTDLRRARQRARASIRSVMQEIQAWLRENDVQTIMDGPEGPGRVNQAVTMLAAQRLREGLVSWLDERHRIAAGRAARAAFDQMQTTLPDDVDTDQLRGLPRVDGTDREWLRHIRKVDAGLLSGTRTATDAGATSDSLAEELGDRITRQLRLGLTQNETVPQLAERVQVVVDGGDPSDRQERGVTGQTARTKAELIAHDSVQDAYNTAARKRYLRNGFRYGVYDATIGTKTTDLCRRMDEHVVDMVDTPWFIPPLHPYCRSGIRPVLKVGDRVPLTQDDVADGFVQTIMSTKSYRPQVVDQAEFQPTPLSIQHGHTAPGA